MKRSLWMIQKLQLNAPLKNPAIIMKDMSLLRKNSVSNINSHKKEKIIKYLNETFLEILSHKYRLTQNPIPVVAIK